MSILGPCKMLDYRVADIRVLLPKLLQGRLSLVSALLLLQKASDEGQQSHWASLQLSCRV